MQRTLLHFLLLVLCLLPCSAWAQDAADTADDAAVDQVAADQAEYAETADVQSDTRISLNNDFGRISLNDNDPLQPASDETVDSLEPVIKGHGVELAMSFLGIPGGVYGKWFVEHGYNWDNGAVNMGFSLNYTMRFRFPMELRLGLTWANLSTGDAYWLNEKRENNPELADYIKNSLSTVAIEAAVYHVIPIIDEVAFYYGGGLWGGVVLGELKAYAIDSNCAQNNSDFTSCRYAPTSNKIGGVPPVIGSLIATIGFKFTLFERMTIRAEGGFKGYLYGQVGVGVEF